jgi:hypothetical protein
MAEALKTPVVDSKNVNDSASEVGSSVIYIEPEREAAARRKFDTFLVPVSLIFIILSALDRNNVGEALSHKSHHCYADS